MFCSDRGNGHRPLFILLLIPLLFLLGGCSSTEVVVETVPQGIVQWPTVKPAVTFVKSISKFSSEERSIWQKIAGVITGEKQSAAVGFVKPVAVAVAPDGSMAIADPANALVHFYNSEKKEYFRITTARKGEDLVSPVGVIFDKRLRLFVSDSYTGEVYAYDRNGRYLFSIEGPEKHRMIRPTGLAYNAANDLLYVSDTLGHRIFIFDSDGGYVSSFGGRGTANGKFNYPTYIFSDANGFLYVTDAMNFRVQIFNARGEFEGIFGHHGDGSGDFSMPKGIAADSKGVIYVVDSLFDNVQLFNKKGKLLLTVGQQGTRLGEFWLPSGCFIDGNGYFYVCDTYNKRVQVFKINGDGF